MLALTSHFSYHFHVHISYCSRLPNWFISTLWVCGPLVENLFSRKSAAFFAAFHMICQVCYHVTRLAFMRYSLQHLMIYQVHCHDACGILCSISYDLSSTLSNGMFWKALITFISKKVSPFILIYQNVYLHFIVYIKVYLLFNIEYLIDIITVYTIETCSISKKNCQWIK